MPLRLPSPALAELPEPDETDPKEVYAYFGLAMYWAQVYERGVINLAVGLLIKKPSARTQQLVDDLYKRLDENTLGRTFLIVRENASIAPDTEHAMRVALRERNFLAHSFFHIHAEDFVHEDGRGTMLRELVGMIHQFRQADLIVDRIVATQLERIGVTQENLDREFEKQFERLRRLREGDSV